MKFKFTIRGLMLLTTVVAGAIAFYFWASQSFILTLLSTYLFAYVGLFLTIYFLSYRRRIRKERRSRASFENHGLNS